MIPQRPDIEMRKEVPAVGVWATIFILAASALFGVVLLSGCAGPSKARYAELLHECREANRERERIIREYDSRVDEPRKIRIDNSHKPGDVWKMSDGCNTTTCSMSVFGAIICDTTAMYCSPEQNFGSVNFGEAGN